MLISRLTFLFLAHSINQVWGFIWFIDVLFCSLMHVYMHLGTPVALCIGLSPWVSFMASLSCPIFLLFFSLGLRFKGDAGMFCERYSLISAAHLGFDI